MVKLKEVTFVEIDRMLKEMLEELKLERKISIDDVKNVIYHEEDLMGAMKLAGGFMPYAKKKKQLDLMVKVLQTAWNYLPHKSLDGLSPHQKAALAKEPKYNSSKTSIYQLFESGLPKQTKLIKLRKGEWGFEFSARYLEIKEQFKRLVREDDGPWDREDLMGLLKMEPCLLEGISFLARSYYEDGEEKKAKEAFMYGVKMMEGVFPAEFDKNKHKLPWAFLENRDFLSFLLDEALFIVETEGELASISYLEQILRYNPNDNQGVRGLLATKYLKTGQSEKAVDLAKKYATDMMPDIILGRTLALFKLGKVKLADDYLDGCIHDCMNSIKEILKTEHVRPVGYDETMITRGGDDEAYSYWLDQGNLWQETLGAVEWLRGIYERHKDCVPFSSTAS